MAGRTCAPPRSRAPCAAATAPRSPSAISTRTLLTPHLDHEESTLVLLNPQVRDLGLILPEQVDRALPTELALDQSLLLVWPQIVALLGLTVAAFAAAYVAFLRQEVRA